MNNQNSYEITGEINDSSLKLINGANRNNDKRYNIKFKLEIIDYAKTLGRNQAAIK